MLGARDMDHDSVSIGARDCAPVVQQSYHFTRSIEAKDKSEGLFVSVHNLPERTDTEVPIGRVARVRSERCFVRLNVGDVVNEVGLLGNAGLKNFYLRKHLRHAGSFGHGKVVQPAAKLVSENDGPITAFADGELVVVGRAVNLGTANGGDLHGVGNRVCERFVHRLSFECETVAARTCVNAKIVRKNGHNFNMARLSPNVPDRTK